MRFIGFDTETGLIVPGCVIPPLVCVSRAGLSSTGLVRYPVLTHENALPPFLELLQDPETCLSIHNAPFDLAVMVQESGKDWEHVLAWVFRAISEGRISDTETREKLLLNAEGLLDTAQGEEGRGVPLWEVVRRYLQIDIKSEKSGPDVWRLRYGELRGVLLELWPEEAVRYAQDDAVHHLLVHVKQTEKARETGYLDPRFPWLVTDERRQLAKKFALHLTSAWGIRTDKSRVQELTKAVEIQVREIEALLLREGLARQESTKGAVSVVENRRVVQDRVREAYSQIYRVSHPDITLPLEDYPLPSYRAIGQPKELTPPPPLDTPIPGKEPGKFTLYRRVEDTQTFQKFSYRPDGGGVGSVLGSSLITPVTAPSDTFPLGQVSYSREVKIASGDPALVAYGQQGDVLKIHSTYVPILVHGTVHPICCSYNELVATGRTSCRRPNIQNLPTFGGVRECHVARNGWVLLDADIDSAECVGWGQWCLDQFGFSQMAEAINRGRDPHLWLAIHFPALAGVTYEEAEVRKRAGDKIIKHYRKLSKVGNFGRMGGMSAETLLEYARGYGIVLTLAEAQEILEAFDRAWPEAALARKWVSTRTRNGQTFTFVQPISERRRGNVGYTDGNNQPFQGRIADLAGDVLRCLSEECYLGKLPGTSWEEYLSDPPRHTLSPLHGSRPWAFIYDEFILEIPWRVWGRDRSDRAARRLEALISERGKFWCPDIRVSSSAAMALRWVKDRKAGTEFLRVLDSRGRIVPMELAQSPDDDAKLVWVTEQAA